MSIKWKLNYGLAAVVAAIIVIAVALVANPLLTAPSTSNQGSVASFLVMLTDPPTVPDGTTQLNLTYTDILLHVTYPNETSTWIPVGATGTVNLLSLVNMSQTLAATTIPPSSSVDKIQFNIADVKAIVNGETYNVTALSNSIVLTIVNSEVNQTLSGVLVDFNPTLVQIQGVDANGATTNYYVLVPSATARIIDGLHDEQRRVGTVVDLDEHHREELNGDSEDFARNVIITSASVIVNGNVTTVSVTLKNDGNTSFRVFGLTLNGDFNSTQTTGNSMRNQFNSHDNEAADESDNENSNVTFEQIHPQTIPFNINGTSLTPMLGDSYEHDGDNEHGTVDANAAASSLILQSNETVTLTFSGVISLQPESDYMTNSMSTLIPNLGSTYTIRLMGEGFQIFNVTATA